MGEIIIRLKGGTGNQLFQVAFAASIAKIYNTKCKFHKYFKNKINRKLEVLSLLNQLSIEEKDVIDNVKDIILDEYDINHPLFFSEKSPLKEQKNDLYFIGYFTNYRLHDEKIINQIKSHVKGLRVINKLKNKNYIAIHLRELIGPKNMKIDHLNFEYYKKALENILYENRDFNIKYAIVFSDLWQNPFDSLLIPKLKELLKLYEIDYINGDQEINSPLEIVNVFAHSKFCIISNSTLSWWGAYLSDGKIFSPVMNLYEPDLKIPDHWQQIYASEIIPKNHHKKLIFESELVNKKYINYTKYNNKRLMIIRISRYINLLLGSSRIIRSFKSWLISKGLLLENGYKVFN